MKPIKGWKDDHPGEGPSDDDRLGILSYGMDSFAHEEVPSIPEPVKGALARRLGEHTRDLGGRTSWTEEEVITLFQEWFQRGRILAEQPDAAAGDELPNPSYVHPQLVEDATEITKRAAKDFLEALFDAKRQKTATLEALARRLWQMLRWGEAFQRSHLRLFLWVYGADVSQVGQA